MANCAFIFLSETNIEGLRCNKSTGTPVGNLEGNDAGSHYDKKIASIGGGDIEHMEVSSTQDEPSILEFKEDEELSIDTESLDGNGSGSGSGSGNSEKKIITMIQ